MSHTLASFLGIILLVNPIRLHVVQRNEHKKGVCLSHSSASTFKCGDVEVLNGVTWYYDWQDTNR